MKVVYGKGHRVHAPATEFAPEGTIPYPESPSRVDQILSVLQRENWAELMPPWQYPLGFFRQIHDADYLQFLAEIYPAWQEAEMPSETIVPLVFVNMPRARIPSSPLARLGYYCYDTTPIVAGTYRAAMESAACALTGAELLLEGEKAVYALCRPPGHHAGRRSCGGYCYINNAALAAGRLAQCGRVAVVDIDYHHGNGTQEIFYTSDRVLFASIHADPDVDYPFFWGRADERGEGAGIGFNHNFPLPPGIGDDRYLEALDLALEIVSHFAPDHLVVSAGLDAFGGDPLGRFSLTALGFLRIGRRLAKLEYPTLLVQEGGYHGERLGELARLLLSPFTT